MKHTSSPLAQRAMLAISFAVFGFAHLAQAQVTTAVDCDLMGLVVNVGSQEDYINIYHPGGYLTSPPSANTMEWLFTDSEGNTIHEETLVNENFVSFNHAVPLTDTLFVSVLLTNDSALLNGNPVACWIEDYLVWGETEFLPGSFLGAWTLGGSVGQDVSATSGVEAISTTEVLLFPQPATDRLTVAGIPSPGSLVIRNVAGQIIREQPVNSPTEELHVGDLETGLYLLHRFSGSGELQETRPFMVARSGN